MTSFNLRTITIFSLIVISVLSSFNVVNAADENPLTIVDADFTINMITATDFSVNVKMNALWAFAFDNTYDTTGIHNLIASSNKSDIETLGVIKSNIHNSIGTQMINIFGDGNVQALQNRPSIENFLFNEEFEVNLSASFFGMNDTINSYQFVNGLLDMGANITYNFNLIADNGWNNTFMFVLSDKMGLIYANTTDFQEFSKVTWIVLNGAGNHANKDAVLIINYKNPTTSQSKTENVFLEFELDSRSVKPTILNINIDCRNINIENYDILPDFVTHLNQVPADGIRLLVNSGLLLWDDLYKNTVKAIEEKIIKEIQSPDFNQTLDLVFSWDDKTTTACETPYDIKKMDNNPPVRAILTDANIELKINDMTSKAIFGLANAGAKTNVTPNSINFGKEIKNIGYNYNTTLKMPEDILLNNQNIYTWNETRNFSGEILSNKKPDYNKEEISTIIEIQAENADLNILSFFTGDTELTFGLKIDEERDYKVTKIPEPFIIPDTIDITYLNSDALRLCIEENVFKEREVNDFLENEKTRFEQNINSILPGINAKGNIKKDIFETSLQWDSDISNMDEEKPIKTETYSHASHPIKFKISLTPPSFKVNDQTYNFTGIANQYVTYKLIFPNGINVYSYDIKGKSHVNKTIDGKNYVEITFSPEEANTAVDVTITLEPNALFVIALLIPCIISFIIALILIIVIVLFRKKRRKRKTPTYSPEPEEDTTGYEDEDYYIPPPPGSK